MTNTEFTHLTQAAGLDARSVAACRLILVDGLSINAAARETGMAASTVSRMLRKIPQSVCKCCGAPM